MLGLARLRQDLDFMRNMGDIVDVFKSTALIQFHLYQGIKTVNVGFLKELEQVFGLLQLHDISSPYFSGRPDLPGAIVIVTSDEGFLGELNSTLINAGLDSRSSAGDKIVMIGERGARYLEDIKERFVFFPAISDEFKYKEIAGIRDYLFNNFGKQFGKILVVYPEFISLTARKITVFPLLPYNLIAAKGARQGNVLVEPSVDDVAKRLVEFWMGFKCIEMFHSAKLAEYAARIMHLEGSTQELGHITQRLTLDYFKERHSLSDKNIREITAAKVILKKTGFRERG